ncbi:hypothetical protein L6452_32037 [Arctium lappa]|uniref:Uncharacterized protein n=1 Tax=Arctium lappa TaxID=4217 RepID=A0ACB8Z3F2_ARCLA|nr:hypothetical protein L6452_32037 [Arctium lappa]
MISTYFGSPSQLKNNLQTDTQLIQKASDFSPKINQPNPSSNWYSSIRIHVSNGTPKEALLIYAQNRRNRLCIPSVIPLFLKACASLSLINFGKALHSESIKAGVQSDVVVGTSIVNMTTVSWIEMIEGYAKTGDTKMARCVFDQVPLAQRNVVTWTVMVEGYASNGEMKAAKDIFEAMPQRNFFVYSSMISGYFKNGDVEEGKGVFDRIKAFPFMAIARKLWSSLIEW